MVRPRRHEHAPVAGDDAIARALDHEPWRFLPRRGLEFRKEGCQQPGSAAVLCCSPRLMCGQSSISSQQQVWCNVMGSFSAKLAQAEAPFNIYFPSSSGTSRSAAPLRKLVSSSLRRRERSRRTACR